MSGLFVTMEGCEGAGKTLQCRKLNRYLSDSGYRTLLTREPGGTVVSEQIRTIILDVMNDRMSPRAEALLYSAARAQLVFEHIRPALTEGKIVICDRFSDSSVAYQGRARSLGADIIKNINAFATGYLKPDITFFLDIEPAESFARKRGHIELDRIELEDPGFHRKVYEGYFELARDDPDRVVIVDARRGPREIHSEIIEKIEPLLKNVMNTKGDLLS